MYLFGQPVVTIGGVDYPAETAEWGPRLKGGNGTMAPLAMADPIDACSPMTVGLNGKIAVADRGSCNFDTKVRPMAHGRSHWDHKERAWHEPKDKR